MVTPYVNDLLNLKRLGRYLLANPRVITTYKYQALTNSLTAWSDSDWAGYKRTRRSTSAPVLCLGNHWLKASCGTQAVVALSSGEAEYYSMVRTCSAALGLNASLNDLGHSTNITLLTDASVAKGIGQRTGLGKVRHLETSQLWLQDLILKGRVLVKKVHTNDNIADILTKHIDAKAIDTHMATICASRTTGKHPLAFKLTS